MEQPGFAQSAGMQQRDRLEITGFEMQSISDHQFDARKFGGTKHLAAVAGGDCQGFFAEDMNARLGCPHGVRLLGSVM